MTYQEEVLADNPTAFYQMDGADNGFETSLVDGAPSGSYGGGVTTTLMPDGSRAAFFNGRDGHLLIPTDPMFSVPTTGALTFEAWIKPDVAEFPKSDGTGYVNLGGKGDAVNGGRFEWSPRIYSRTNTEVPPRPNHVSGYAFNLPGGKGAGSRISTPAMVGEWLHVVFVIDTLDVDPQHPTGRTWICRNGVLVDMDPLNSYGIVPVASDAPVRIGTREGGTKSHFLGAIGAVAFYDYALSPARASDHFAVMTNVLFGG